MNMIEKILDSKWYRRKSLRKKIRTDRFLMFCYTAKELVQNVIEKVTGEDE